LEENLFKKDLFRLRIFYHLLRQFLYVHFGPSYILHTDEETNSIYLELCFKIEDILKKPEFSELTSIPWKPFENILDVDTEYPEGDWEYGGHQICDNFSSKIDELYIKNGKQEFPLSPSESTYIKKFENFLSGYKNYKKSYDEAWLEKIKKTAKQWNANQSVQIELPQISTNSPYQLVFSDLKDSLDALNNNRGKQAITSAGTAMHSMLEIFHRNKLKFEDSINLLKNFPEKKKHVTDLHYIRKKRNDYSHPNADKPDFTEAKIIIETSIKIFKDFV